MERNYDSSTSAFIHIDELDWRTAYHEAGHAAAIHIGNRQRQLPPVFFEIQIKRPSKTCSRFQAKVIDGNLIQNIPIAVLQGFSSLPGVRQPGCQRAFEADVTNLLVGPLAEAKYVAQRDGEVFNRCLVNLKALHNYGGYSDLEKVEHYLESFIANRAERKAKLADLFRRAFMFTENPAHWRCIQQFAEHILDCQQEVITCDDAIRIFDKTHLKTSRHALI
ncbi:MAG: hypothetical protein KGZ80_05290 [Methylomonas sp.]|nr:hypothetical protein [Methylomonas sp.]PPD19874.1 MAG: hypothetical protein CTY23_10510 [Methylomonas sp.]PPD25442.1 MAG: hypothetical protein CTY22_08640 [Methylomonas sp.]PPD36087.1 MAG: hypothetical protein CTY21_08645 [Methylomonas sp.]PPD39401.1 MAG: hypothetical protein CTY17_08145 [Methylomonas sp.]